jgi:hypothetical protein
MKHGSVHRHPSFVPFPYHPSNVHQVYVMLLATGLGFAVLATIFYADAEVAAERIVDLARILVGTIPIGWYW